MVNIEEMKYLATANCKAHKEYIRNRNEIIMDFLERYATSGKLFTPEDFSTETGLKPCVFTQIYERNCWLTRIIERRPKPLVTEIKYVEMRPDGSINEANSFTKSKSTWQYMVRARELSYYGYRLFGRGPHNRFKKGDNIQ